MKISKYNFTYTSFIKDSDKSLIYNSRTGALAVLEPENYQQLKAFENGANSIEDKEFEKQVRFIFYGTYNSSYHGM